MSFIFNLETDQQILMYICVPVCLSIRPPAARCSPPAARCLPPAACRPLPAPYLLIDPTVHPPIHLSVQFNYNS